MITHDLSCIVRANLDCSSEGVRSVSHRIIQYYIVFNTLYFISDKLINQNVELGSINLPHSKQGQSEESEGLEDKNTVSHVTPLMRPAAGNLL